jgi:hypothetical protein
MNATKIVHADPMPGRTLGDLKIELERKPGGTVKSTVVVPDQITIENMTDDDDLPNLGAPPADPKAMVQALVERADAAVKKADTAEEALRGLLGNIVKNVEYLRALRADRVTEAAAKDVIVKVEGDLAKVINYFKDPSRKIRVARAFALAMAGTCPASRYALTELVRGSKTGTTALPGLVELGILEEIKDNEDQRPALWAQLPVFEGIDIVGRDGEKHLKLNPILITFKVNDGEIGKDLTLRLRDAARRTAEQGREFFASKRAGLDEALRKLTESGVVQITKEQFRAKEHGCIVLTTPDRPGRNDQVYPGGIALFESGPKGVRVVSAIGRFERRMTSIAERSDRFVPVAMLTSAGFNPGREMKQEVHADLFILHQALYHGLKAADEREAQTAERAQLHAEQVAQVAAEREKYSALATIGFVEAFAGAAPVDQKAFVDYSVIDNRHGGVWEVTHGEKVTKYRDLLVVVEWNEAGHIKAEFPERLAPLFGDYLAEFKDPGDRYGNMPYPWQQFLRTCYANASFQRRKAAKQGDPTGTVPAADATNEDEVPLVR